MKTLTYIILLMLIVACKEKEPNYTKLNFDNGEKSFDRSKHRMSDTLKPKINYISAYEMTRKQDSVIFHDFREKIKIQQNIADSLCKERGHLYEYCESDLFILKEKNSSSVIYDNLLKTSLIIDCEHLDSCILVDFVDFSLKITKEKKFKYCYRCCNCIEKYNNVKIDTIWKKIQQY